MRKLKKLTLKKEVVSNLDGNEMNQLKGREDGVIPIPLSIFYDVCHSLRTPCPKYPTPESDCCDTLPCTSSPCTDSKTNIPDGSFGYWGCQTKDGGWTCNYY